MLRQPHPASLRTLALLVLLWVGCDIGAHGLFASDFPPVAVNGSSVLVGQDEGGATPRDANDHCFCHGLSTLAVMLMLTAGLTPVGTLVPDSLPQVPHIDSRPLDRPPQVVA